jgi:small subunit ribosomal protein S6
MYIWHPYYYQGEKFMIREYQTILIVSANLDEAGIEATKAKFEKAIGNASGKIVQFENLGKRELATYFDKQHQGYFLRITFEGESNSPSEVATLVRNNDEVLRQITVITDSIKPKAAAAA